jgi:hypothetical protein
MWDHAAMKTALNPQAHTPHCQALVEQKARTYSLPEAAHVLGVPLSNLREILEKHALHAEPGFRGARVSRQEVLSYVSSHPTRLAEPTRGISC